jgi:hypothetical protein
MNAEKRRFFISEISVYQRPKRLCTVENLILNSTGRVKLTRPVSFKHYFSISLGGTS